MFGLRISISLPFLSFVFPFEMYCKYYISFFWSLKSFTDSELELCLDDDQTQTHHAEGTTVSNLHLEHTKPDGGFKAWTIVIIAFSIFMIEVWVTKLFIIFDLWLICKRMELPTHLEFFYPPCQHILNQAKPQPWWFSLCLASWYRCRNKIWFKLVISNFRGQVHYHLIS